MQKNNCKWCNLFKDSVTNGKILKRQEMGIHIGHLIKTEFDRQGRRAMWLASELNCNRANVYNIFHRDNIDIAMLIKISKVLQHNFFQDIANLIDDGKCLKSLDNMSRNPIQNVQKEDTVFDEKIRRNV